MSKKADIQLQRIRYLRGPNIWTYRPVLEVWLDLGELEAWPSNLLPGFTDRLLALLPALVEHHCGVGERGGFLQRLESGTWAGHILEHVVIELLNLSRMPTGFGQTRSTSQPGVYRMVFRARDETVARAALSEGHRLLMAAINDEPFDVAAAVAKVCEKVDDCYLGPSTACIVGAATDRGIPHIRLNGGNLVQLGHGASQRRIWTCAPARTSPPPSTWPSVTAARSSSSATSSARSTACSSSADTWWPRHAATWPGSPATASPACSSSSTSRSTPIRGAA